MKNMTPSKEITAGEIAKVNDNLAAALRKSGLQSEPTQQALEQNGPAIISEMVAVLRKYAEKFCDMIICHVTVDRNQKPHDALKATGLKLYASDDVVETMPKGSGAEVDVVFFKPEPWEYSRPGWISNDDVAKCYERRSLKSDPYAQAKANQDDPAFSDTHPNGTQWKDANGKWCFAAFSRWDDGRRDGVVHRSGNGWYGYWLFGGSHIGTQSSVPQLS